MRFSFLAVPFISILALACSGSVVDNNTGDGDSVGDGDAGDGDAGGDGDSGDGDGDSGDGDGDSGDGDGDSPVVNECEDFGNQYGDSVLVEIVNEKSVPIYLGPEESTCGSPSLFSIADAAGPLVVGSDDPCSSTCEDLMNTDPIACPAICLFPSVYELEPGESLERWWDGVVLEQQILPNECSEFFGPGDGEISCAQPVRPAGGTYTFGAVAGTAPTCGDWDVVCTECNENEFGDCVVENSSVIGGNILEASAEYALADRVTQDPSEPDGDAEPDVPVIPDTVRIVFTD